MAWTPRVRGRSGRAAVFALDAQGAGRHPGPLPALDRDPTDAELEMPAQTGSEHCVHKTFKARIHLTEAGKPPEVVDGLFNQYIKAATLKADSPWLQSVFVDNAGVVAFDDALDLAFKVETTTTLRGGPSAALTRASAASSGT
ncbi:MAG: hypothetical protein R3F43_12545 [bacterium]